MSKRILFILGMHRSGTSAVAGAIHLCGVPGGRRFMLPSFDNEKGFFENQNAVEINEGILKALNLSWDQPFCAAEHWLHDSKMQHHLAIIQHFLATELQGNNVFYLKDPRFCYTLPLWQKALKELGIHSQYLISLRDPAEISLSLKSRNGLGNKESLALWLNYVLLAEKNTRGFERLFVQFNNLLDDPIRQIGNVLQMLQVGTEISANQKEQIRDFIDKKLKHQSAATTSIVTSKFPYCTTVKECLGQLVQEPESAEALVKLDKIRQRFLQNQAFFSPGGNQEFFASLKFEAGEHTRMIAPIKIPVYEGLPQLVFPLDHIKVPIEKAIIFPCNHLAHVILDTIKILYEDGSTASLTSFGKRAILEHGNNYFFGGKQSLVVEPDPQKRPKELMLDIKYVKLGSDALQSMAKIGAEVNDWFYERMQEQEGTFERRLQEISALVQSKEVELEEALTKAETISSEYTAYQKDKEQAIENLEAALRQANEELSGKTAEIAGFIQTIESLKQQALAQQDEIKGLGLEINSQYNTILGLNKNINSPQQQMVDLDRAIKSLTQRLEAGQREIANYKNTLKKKDDQIWEIYSRSQHFEKDYRQSLRTLDDVRASFSYRLGWALTAPLRFFYNLLSKKPINETPIWLAWQFVLAGVRMPGRMLSNINAQNIETLRKALKNESPREIVGNLIKLLNGVPRGKTAFTEEKPVPTVAPTLPVVAVLPEKEKQNGQAAQPSQVPTVLNNAKQTVLFASPYLPDFDGSSGGKRATRMLGLLAEACDVYAFTLGEKPDKHVRKLESLGVKVFQGEDFLEVKKLVPRVDTIIFSFFYTYFDCGKFLTLYPNAQVVVDSVDVHWVRHERSRGLWPELTDDVISKKKALEIEVYRKAGIIWAVTEQDKQAILNEVPTADVRIVSNVHSPEKSAYKDSGNHNLLFMGGYAHYPNIIAAKKLALEIFPKIREQVPKARLLLAGSHAPQEVIDLGKLPGVEVLGFIDENSLSDLYGNTFLALAPLQAGAGIKGKICEAISFRVPVVTNAVGNEGIGLVNEESGLIADEDEVLVKLAVKALHHDYNLAAMTQSAIEKLNGLVGPQTVKKNMLDSIMAPEISICIVTWNKQKLLQRCIESIENHTNGIKYRILVYSNGCTDGTRQYLEAAAKLNSDIVPILSDTNDVFVIPNNRMVQLFPANDVVLLNNDTYVTEGWLTALREAAYSSPDIGIAGAKILYPDGRLQEFGSELYADGTGRNIGKWDDPGKDEYNTPAYTGYVSGCAFYVKRETIDKIGFFDEAFHPCYCEDSDYCYTAWEHGIATIVTPDCIIYHDEGGTSGTDTNKGFKAYQKVNFEKFLKKHGDKLDEISTKIKLKNLMVTTGNTFTHSEI